MGTMIEKKVREATPQRYFESKREHAKTLLLIEMGQSRYRIYASANAALCSGISAAIYVLHHIMLPKEGNHHDLCRKPRNNSNDLCELLIELTYGNISHLK